jgi:hypothetical protein
MTMADRSNRLDNFHHSGFQFVHVELETGLTFARIALGAKGANKIERNRTNARKAYDSALHALSSLVLDNEQTATVREKVNALKASLEKLGEKV